MDWISVKDRLPENEEWVLALGRLEGLSRIAVVNCHKSFFGDDRIWSIISSECGWCNQCLDDVTHWMPLPNPPENVGENIL